MGGVEITTVDLRFQHIAELIQFINNPTLSHHELAKYLTLRTFKECNAYAVYISKLNSEAQLEMIDSFGLTSEQTQNWKIVPLSQEVPSTDAVKEDRLVWISDRADWQEQYPNLSNYPENSKLKTLINAPLYLTGSPIGVLGIMCEKEIRATSEEIAYVDIIAGLVSLHFSKAQTRSMMVEERSSCLTKRQITILEMISQQMTNLQIARELGYSESTIRHETMRIYELLQASGRRDAVGIARKLEIIK